MAVTTTPRSLIEAAYGRSAKNRPDQIATAATELLEVVVRIFRGIFAGAARINPTFFGAQASVAFSAPGWTRPEGAQLIYRIEAGSGVTGVTAGTEIIPVPQDQKTIEPSRPTVWELGQVFRPTSGSATVPPISPQNGNLEFFYSKRPSTPATIDVTVDALWIEDFNDLVVARIARYLALKDGRAEEIDGLTAEIAEWATQFVAFLEHATANEVRDFAHGRRFNTPSLVATMSLIAGPGREGA